MTPPTAPLSLEDVIAQDALWSLTLPMEEQEGVRERCQTRVVESIVNLVEIADDERSDGLSSLELSSSLGTSLPELEDQENIPQFNYENMNVIPIPPPVGNPPPYAVSGQHAVWSKGVPKSTFHPYPLDRHPLAQLFQHAKVETGRFPGHSLLGQTTSASSSYFSGDYGVVHSGADGEDQCRSSGGRGSLSSPSPSGGNHLATGEEGAESLFDLFSRTRAGQL